MTKDTIANMITKIRNGLLARHQFVDVTFSKINCSILNILLRNKYITSYKILMRKNLKKIQIYLKYRGWWIKKPVIQNIERISSSGQRIFSTQKTIIEKLKQFLGIYIISTSSGIISNLKLKKYQKGGEILCKIE
jgi:small subunit ribosomal protein S8